MKLNKKDLKRFRECFQEGHPDDCWEWRGNIASNGYGRFFLLKGRERKYVGAHRIAYTHAKGKIKNHIDHLCRNRKCVNPNHLEDVTCKENVLRGVGPAAINARKTQCPKGHPYDRVVQYKGRNHPTRVCSICNRESVRRWRKKNSLLTV